MYKKQDSYNIGITLSENTSESSRRASLTLTYGSKELDMATTQGVLTGRDAFEHILCGASMVQIGTTLHKDCLLYTSRCV